MYHLFNAKKNRGGNYICGLKKYILIFSTTTKKKNRSGKGEGKAAKKTKSKLLFFFASTKLYNTFITFKRAIPSQKNVAKTKNSVFHISYTSSGFFLKNLTRLYILNGGKSVGKKVDDPTKKKTNKG